MAEAMPPPRVKPRRKDKLADGTLVYPMTAAGTNRFERDRRAWEKQQGQLRGMRERPLTGR